MGSNPAGRATHSRHPWETGGAFFFRYVTCFSLTPFSRFAFSRKAAIMLTSVKTVRIETMTTPPTRTRVRRTAGSKTLGEYIDRHGLRPVAVYIPEPLHRALSMIAVEADTSIQALITVACNTYYGGDVDLPPLVAPTRTKTDPHKSVTWYADVDLHKAIKLLAVELDCTVQQLILSAVVDSLKDSQRIKALKIKTGYAPYARAPVEGVQPVREA